MKPDDTLCYCFRVSRRKVEAYIRIHHPVVASQLSQCGGAGTGCGWCVPFLKKLFEDASRGGAFLDAINVEEYAGDREEYRQVPKGDGVT